MQTPKQWWTQRRELAKTYREESRQIEAALAASANPAALRRTVAYLALYGTLSSSQFDTARSRDPILRQAGSSSELIREAVAAGLLDHLFSVGLPIHGYKLTDVARRHTGFFLAGGRTVVTPDLIDAGYLDRSPGRLVSPPWSAGRDFGK